MRPDRTTLRRILGFAALALLAGLWLVVRPTVLRVEPFARFYEFPVGLALVALLAWVAMRPARARETPERPWRRHAQVVRAVPDPEAAPLESALDAWVERGDDPQAAARVLARALDIDADAATRLEAEMRSATSRRKREAIVERAAANPTPFPDTAVPTGA